MPMFSFMKGPADAKTLQHVQDDNPLPVALPADVDAAYDVSAEVTAPLAGTVVGDTGAVAAGTYRIVALLGASDAVAAGAGLKLEVRDAANGATLKRVIVSAGQAANVEVPRITLAANERVRAVTGTAGAAGSVYTSWIQLYPIT